MRTPIWRGALDIAAVARVFNLCAVPVPVGQENWRN